MTGPRSYSAGTRAALAQLSRGRCYNPRCPAQQSIIKFIDGEPFIDYQIAHIRDAEQGNRHDSTMTDDERRSFANQPRPAVQAVPRARRQGPPRGLHRGGAGGLEADPLGDG
jgi:hypothetical protein